VVLGTLAQRAMRRASFLKGYFLGNRGLGAWALALTATVQSGGTFMGFPSLVYSHGWVVAIWISSYMVVPLTAFALIGKRVARFSRRLGAITLPDLLRERFGSPRVGLAASLFILFFLTFNMVAQFKAGALIMKVAWPDTGVFALPRNVPGSLDPAYYLGLGIFAFTVVGYTVIGGFLGAVWTDLLQSLMMFVGVLVLLVFAVSAAGGTEEATRKAVEATGPEYAFAPGYSKDGRLFLPLGLAVSFFLIWSFTGTGQPSSMVRVMASRNTQTMRRSIFLLAFYNFLIYVPLIMICICGRALIPDLPQGKTDEIVPRLALKTTSGVPGGSLIAGLILAAPFGAVMSTVSSYLVVIASGLVRDVYQRFINPVAGERRLRVLSGVVLASVGLIAVLANLRPVDYLQAIIVFSGTGAASTFLMPVVLALYWRRATAAGCMAGMVAGAGTVLLLMIAGWLGPDPLIGQATKFRPYFLLGLDPFPWGLAASLAAGVGVSLATRPPEPARVSDLFER